jgi:thiol-disulfide isomerase/thioredoxin
MSHTWSINRKVRKTHKCWGCCGDIPIGSVVKFTTTIDNGFCSAYWCDTCQTVIDGLESWQKEDGFSYGGIKDGWPEAYEK